MKLGTSINSNNLLLIALCLFVTCKHSFAMATSNANTNSNTNGNSNGNTKHHATDSEWGQIGTASDADADAAADASFCDTSCNTPTNEVLIGEMEDIGSAVAIIGGGIAGFALAAGLSALNVPFVIYERAPQLRSQSQGTLVLRASGYRAMESIDPQLATVVSQEGVELKTVHSRIISKEGEITEREILNMKEMEVKKSGVVTVALKWNVLQSTLSSTVPKGAIKTGHSLTSFKELDGDGGGGGVLLTFDNGRRVRCRALLGCDGTFSRVRKQMYDPKIDPVINYGMVNWSSILPQAQLPGGGKPLTHTISAISKSSPPAMITFLNQCGDDQVFWQIRITDPKAGLALSTNEGRGGLGLVGAKERLLSVLTAPGMEELAGAVAATPEKDIFERCILARQSVPGPWTGMEGVGKGRVTLIGDAAQAMNPGPGLGANTALEGVAVLIDAVRNELRMLQEDKNDDEDKNDEEISKDNICWERILNNYEQKHRPRADLNQQFSNVFGLNKDLIKPDGLTQLHNWVQQPVGSMGEPPKEVVDELNDINVLARDEVSPLLY